MQQAFRPVGRGLGILAVVASLIVSGAITLPAASAVVPTATIFGMAANGETALRAAEKKLGVKAGVQGTFTDFAHGFPKVEAKNAAARGAALMISWEPWDATRGYVAQPEYSLDRIASGALDSYIRQFAVDAAATRMPVFVRFAAEMNGDWNVWSAGSFGNSSQSYIAAFRRVVAISDASGASNIRWVFNPIVSYEGSVPLASVYPGDDVVDWVALDGYNWGSMKWGWQEFEWIFAAGLAELRTVAPSKPLAIAEIGCVPDARKAAWVSDALKRARASGAAMVVWFEHLKEADWRLSSDRKVAAAARTVVTSTGWVTGGSTTATLAAINAAESAATQPEVVTPTPTPTPTSKPPRKKR